LYASFRKEGAKIRVELEVVVSLSFRSWLFSLTKPGFSPLSLFCANPPACFFIATLASFLNAGVLVELNNKFQI
jgi:hypothetical protein